jgi:hypothetical protein
MEVLCLPAAGSFNDNSAPASPRSALAYEQVRYVTITHHEEQQSEQHKEYWLAV